jgi:glycosyltransferase involved in cell wall biosynthesis
VTQPLVSVIIPCYAQARFLPEALSSLRAQTYQQREVLVVDDGSPDDVAAAIASYPEVIFLRQEHLGLSAARNRALAAARGELVVCLDADDRLLPHALAIGAQALAERPECGFVFGFRSLIDAAGRPIPEVFERFQGPFEFASLLRQNVIGPPVVVMFRRAVLDAVGGFSLRQHHAEDYELYLRLARTHAWACHGELIAEYRQHDANMSLNSRGMLTGNLRALADQEAWIGGDLLLRRALAAGRRNAWLMHDAAPRLDRLGQEIRARRWLAAIRLAVPFFVRYPRLFLSAVARRLRRGSMPPPS